MSDAKCLGLGLLVTTLLSACASAPVGTRATLMGTWRHAVVGNAQGARVVMEFTIREDSVKVRNVCIVPSGRKLAAVVTAAAKITDRSIVVLESKASQAHDEVAVDPAKPTALVVTDTCEAHLTKGEVYYRLKSATALELEVPNSKDVQVFHKE
jgi:hypothetical protein